MKTIKLIDLLVKVANAEDVPKNIEYNNIGYHWTGASYYNTCIDAYLEKDICLEDLNYPVKIIEEKPKKIETFNLMYPISKEYNGEIGVLVSIYNSILGKIDVNVQDLTKAVNYLLEKEENNPIERIEFDD